MKSASRRILLLAIFITVRFASPLQAYAPLGHEIVGAIADERLAGTKTGREVSALLDGVSLERAAVMADTIKSWDKKGPDDPKSFHYSAWPKIDAQLREFWKANQPTHDPNSAMPSHHWFHYTDVPLMPAQKYGDGKAGRIKWDVVHMIPYCVEVLQGRVPEDNERKITKPIAIILLAHYVGDIHQPLHVGAEYFDAQGNVDDPDKDKSALADEGGNTFSIELSDEPPRGRGQHKKKFHGFWDNDAVNALFPEVPEKLTKDERKAQLEPAKKKFVHEMATHEPKNWRLPDTIELKNYAEAWADEILPIAREAHERLDMKDVKPLQQEDRVIAGGEAVEKPAADHMTYRAWSARIVREELQKAGWRLADLLEKGLAPIGPASPSAAPQSSASETSSSTPAPTPVAEATPDQTATPEASPMPTDAESNEPETTSPTPATAEPSATETTPPPASPSPTSIYGDYPSNYREIIATWMKAKGLDTSRIDWQTQPKPASLPGANGRPLYGYLVIFNTRAATRGGPQTRGALIRDGKVVNASGFGK